jgi:hypothetical protein
MTEPSTVATRLYVRGAVIERLNTSFAGPAIRHLASRVSSGGWKRRGRPAPAPPHVKHQIVRALVRRAGMRTFVETGTYRGDTLAVVRGDVDCSISIELDEELARRARRRFRRCTDVTILQGDSAVLLPEVVGGLREPAIFWLDGHFSGGVTARGSQVTPIENELASILDPRRPDHCVLVDDARLFDGTDGYPTMDRIAQLVHALRPAWRVHLADDIARIGLDPHD